MNCPFHKHLSGLKFVEKTKDDRLFYKDKKGVVEVHWFPDAICPECGKSLIP